MRGTVFTSRELKGRAQADHPIHTRSEWITSKTNRSSTLRPTKLFLTFRSGRREGGRKGRTDEINDCTSRNAWDRANGNVSTLRQIGSKVYFDVVRLSSDKKHSHFPNDPNPFSKVNVVNFIALFEFFKNFSPLKSPCCYFISKSVYLIRSTRYSNSSMFR